MDLPVETKMAAPIRNHHQRLNAQQFDRIFSQEKELFDVEPSSADSRESTAGEENQSDDEYRHSPSRRVH